MENQKNSTLSECRCIVFSTKELTGDTTFMSPTVDVTFILRGRPRHAEVQPFAVQR